LTDPAPPSTSTIWRILKRRGFVTPQPHKRPKSSYVRFEASLPNETWQSDVTVFELKDGTKVEILNFLDDFSRVCVASKVLAVTKSPDVVATLYEAGGAWGLPASLLTDIQTQLAPFNPRIERPMRRGLEGPAPTHRRCLTERSAVRLLAC
jgi:transposase InsO family protein